MIEYKEVINTMCFFKKGKRKLTRVVKSRNIKLIAQRQKCRTKEKLKRSINTLFKYRLGKNDGGGNQNKKIPNCKKN